MKLTLESFYALKALVYLAENAKGRTILIKEIVDNCSIPKSFCAKTMQKLAKNNIVRSHRGAQRGFTLSKEAKDLSIKEVLEAVEGKDIFSKCIFWSKACDEDSTCPLHDSWWPIKDNVLSWARITTLADMLKPGGAKTGPTIKPPLNLGASQKDKKLGKPR